MEGIINVRKPPGMTSADVVAWVRRTLRIKKAGHTGTLDPAVEGVLPVCCGKATRLAEYLTEQGKAYRLEMVLGITTDTQDAGGKVLDVEAPQVAQEDLCRVMPQFIGEIEQVPPMFSAIRKNGKHLYEYARAGEIVERTARKVHISRLELIEWQPGEYPHVIMDVECSKGTYIRTLCQDIGEALGCGAHMASLLRLRSGPFRIEESWTLENIKTAADNGSREFLLPVFSGLQLPVINLPAQRVEAFCRGLPTSAWQIGNIQLAGGTEVQVFAGGEFIGIGIWRDEELQPHKVLV